MPELPDVTVYVEHLERRLVGRTLLGVRIGGPNLLRTVEPPAAAAAGRAVTDVRRLGKRIVVALEGGLLLAIHLMIAGRLHWKRPGAALPRRSGQLALDFEHGALLLIEAATRQRASLHVILDEAGLTALDRGGLEPVDAPLAAFRARLRGEDHTLKRALTDPRLFSGIGNAYSDEILHAARLSPIQRTPRLSDPEIERLWVATRQILRTWTERLREEAGESFPERVTAFREGMAVHGRWRRPCPACGSPVQRIVYADNQTN